jgi:hypothetical protein
MELSKFGSETNITVGSENGVYHPVAIVIDTPQSLEFQGDLDVQKLLSEQIDILQKNANAFVARVLTDWVTQMVNKRMLTSQPISEKQVSADVLGNETCVRIDHFQGGAMRISVWLPGGVICSSAKPMDELKAALNRLRNRIAADLKQEGCQVYAGKVNLQPAAIDATLLALDLELAFE